jgi:hypothetical protein
MYYHFSPGTYLKFFLNAYLRSLPILGPEWAPVLWVVAAVLALMLLAMAFFTIMALVAYIRENKGFFFMDPMCRELTGILPYPKPYSSQTDTERETGVEFMAHQLRGILCWNKTCPAPDAYIRCMLYFSPDMRNNVQLQKFMFHLIFRPKIDGFSGKATGVPEVQARNEPFQHALEQHAGILNNLNLIMRELNNQEVTLKLDKDGVCVQVQCCANDAEKMCSFAAASLSICGQTLKLLNSLGADIPLNSWELSSEYDYMGSTELPDSMSNENPRPQKRVRPAMKSDEDLYDSLNLDDDESKAESANTQDTAQNTPEKSGAEEKNLLEAASDSNDSAHEPASGALAVQTREKMPPPPPRRKENQSEKAREEDESMLFF